MLQDTDALKSRISVMVSDMATWGHRVNEIAAELWDAKAVPEGNWFWRHRDTRRLAPLRVSDPSHEQVFSVLDELCDYYLTATPDERTAVRKLFDADTIMSLLSYAGSAGDQIKSNGDTNWLRRGLAALSMADFWFDWRDVLDSIGELYIVSARVGIEPQPFLYEVGRKSSTLQGQGGCSSWEIFMNFQQTRFFEIDVLPHLPKS